MEKNGGYVSLITIILVILKLTNVINWSWFWVLSPIWLTGVIGLGFAVGVLFVWVIFRK